MVSIGIFLWYDKGYKRDMQGAMMEGIASFGYWVRRRRKALDLTQATLAQRVGCATVTIKKIERDERRPSRQMADLLAEHLAIPEVERDDFLRLARGKFVPAMPSPLETLPPPVSLPGRPPAPRHNLPPQPSSFIGRKQELAEIARLVRHEPGCRLLTLVGPGGIGKTRLALQAAADVIEAFAHGVYFVSLAPVSAVESLVPTIADAFSFSFFGGADPQVQLLNYLREKEMLLVLDNFEHLLTPPEQGMKGGTDLLSAILMTASQVKLLVTSRERLQLQEEWIFDVPGLPYPASEREEREALETYSAVELFLQRARQAKTEFSPSEAELVDLVRICQLVEGMPLSLELAAAWVRMMSCREIAQEIGRNLDFLATSMRNIPERHQSLRAVFRHSWQLLSEEESAVFRKLSVFRGGFLAEAAEQVASASLSALAALVDKSLLRRTQGGRYEIHELLRQYAAEKLEAMPGEKEQTQDRHADYYAAFLHHRADDLKGWRQKEALAEISADIDNVRTAWQWAVGQKKVEVIRKSLESFFLINTDRGWFREGEAAFRRAVANLSEAEAVEEIKEISLSKEMQIVLGQLLTCQGYLCVRLGLYEQARELAQKGVVLLRQAGSGVQRELAVGLIWLGFVDQMLGKFAEANQSFQESLTLFTEVGDRWGIGAALLYLGQNAEHQGLFAEAGNLLQESMRVLKQVGDLKFGSYSLDYLGHVARELGNFPQAQTHFEEALKIRQEMGNREDLVYSLANLGNLDRIVGRYSQAKQRFQAGLALAKEIGFYRKIADFLDLLGAVARVLGEYEQAQQLYQESLVTYREINAQRYISFCLNNLGRLAYDRGAYQEAEQYLQESLALSTQNRHERERLSCLRHLGYVAGAGGKARQQEAAQYFYQALELATKIQSVPTVLDSLLGLAILLAQTGNKQRAVELLNLALHHPGSEQETKDRAAKLQAKLTAGLPSAVVTNAQARGQALELWVTVDELLAENVGWAGPGQLDPTANRQDVGLHLPSTQPVEVEQPVFVARERELAQLDGFLDRSLTGQGRVIFVVGEAGSGKTALVQTFTERALEAQPDLIAASGNCNAFTGVGDPYLPFREILELLTGDVEARWEAGAITRDHAQRLWDLTPHLVLALVNNGPDLIDTFIPGAALVTRATSTAPSDAEWLTQLQQLVARKEVAANLRQQDLFEQYAKVLQALARQRPLLLVLDDLQWADAGSLNLLFHLGRRLARSRTLLVGIYRPHDVAIGRDGERHPLEPVVNEFQRDFGANHIDLNRTEGRAFVEAYLETEPNRLSTAFQEALHRQTRGQALFTVEMLRGLQERGDLVRDEHDRWVEGPSLDWETLPARVEGVIGERIGRLPATLQEALKVASVEGEFFTAEVVARVQAIDELKLVRQLSSELDKQHRLVRSQGSQRLSPGGYRLSQYRFRHILFQRYLYNNLDEVERVYLHEAVGSVLEQLYEGQTDEVAGKLARHFQTAGPVVKAAGYLHQAGKRAVRLSANEEAIGHFTKALGLLETLPDTSERAQQELTLLLALGEPLVMTKGYGAPELEQTYMHARELCQQVGETSQLFPVLRGLWHCYSNRAGQRRARALGEQLFTLAQYLQDPILLMQAHWVLGENSFYIGEMVTARTHLEQAIALHDPQAYRSHPFRAVQDPGPACRRFVAYTLWLLGYPGQALIKIYDALTLARELSHPINLVYTLELTAVLYLFRGEGQRAQERAEAAIALATEHGLNAQVPGVTIELGAALVQQGKIEEGIAQMRQGLDVHRTAEASVVWRPYNLGRLAEAYTKADQAKEGLIVLAEAMAIVNKTEKHFYEAELYRLKGELLLKVEGGGRTDELPPEAYFLRAVDIARRQSTKSLELRAVMSLSRLWRDQGKKEEARQMLAEIYDWFIEGFDTGDLKEAKALLEELS